MENGVAGEEISGEAERVRYCETEERSLGPVLCLSPQAELQDLSETILLVEDEGFVREVAREVLKSAGYKVLLARSAAEAVDAYDRCAGQLDLLLTDVVLPGQNGRSLAQALSQRNPELRVLLMSGYLEQIHLSESEPGLECLPKPFSAWALLQGVRRALDHKPEGQSQSAPKNVCGNA